MNRSKEVIAEAFLSLLDEKSFNKITVKDIVERCGVNRNTFYYHFCDIPTLLEQILVSRIDDFVNRYANIDSLKECINVTVNYFLENKRAILHVYHSLQRDIFIFHLDRLLMRLVSEYINKVSKDLVIDESDKALIIRFFKCMLVGVFLDWLGADMEYDLLEDSIRIYDLQEDAALKMLMNAKRKNNY